MQYRQLIPVCITACLALLPALTAFGLLGDTTSTPANQLFILSLTGTALLALLSSKLWIGLLLLSPWTVVAPLEIFYLWEYRKPSDAHVLGILGETTFGETRDFAGFYLPLLVICMLAAATVALYAIHAARRAGMTYRHRSRHWIVLGCALTLLAPWLSDWASAQAAPESLDHQSMAGASDLASAEGDELARNHLDWVPRGYAESYPLGVPLRFYEFLHYRKTLAHLSERLAGFRFGAQQRPMLAKASTALQRQVHVLVIGETGRPDRWQLNGYERETTPRLSGQGNLVSFSNVVSPWAWTRMSVPVIVTRKPGTDTRPFFAERSVVAAFREAGFRTYWLSTQSPLGPHDSSIALHAHEAHETRFLNPANYMRRGALDGDLLAPLAEVLARGEPRQFIVLHTLGGHYNYSHRYPPEFDHFKPSLLGHPNPSLQDRSQKLEMNNAYDNSVRYTDHVLAEVIGMLEKTGQLASLFYVADHGENLFDGDCPQSGHGRNTERDFRVASMFWYSDEYARRFPAKVKNARRHADAPLSTMAVFPSLLDAADVGFSGEDPTASLFNAQWQPRARPTQTGLDFDLAARDPICKKLNPPRRSAH